MKETNKRTEYNKNWQHKNKDHAQYLRYRSSARSFIRNKATEEDIEELEKLIAIRKEEFKKE